METWKKDVDEIRAAFLKNSGFFDRVKLYF